MFAAYDVGMQVIRGVGATREEAKANSAHITDDIGYVILPLSPAMQEHLEQRKQPIGLDGIVGIDFTEHGGMLMTNSEYEIATEDDDY